MLAGHLMYMCCISLVSPLCEYRDDMSSGQRFQTLTRPHMSPAYVHVQTTYDVGPLQTTPIHMTYVVGKSRSTETTCRLDNIFKH